MRKFLFVITLMFIGFLTACVDIDTVENNYIDEGYSKSNDASEVVGEVLNSFDDDLTVESYIYTLDAKVAVILVFDGSEALENELDDNNTLQGFIEDLEEERLVINNMLLIPIALSDESVEEIITIFNE